MAGGDTFGHTLQAVVDGLVVVVEAAGALVIVAGAAVSFVLFLAALPKRNPTAFVPIRLTLGRFLALGLEFQLASDILKTAVGPSLQGLAQLAAVAAIRTALNFFLAREIREEQRLLAERGEQMPGLPQLGGSDPADGEIDLRSGAPDQAGHADGNRGDPRSTSAAERSRGSSARPASPEPPDG